VARGSRPADRLDETARCPLRVLSAHTHSIKRAHELAYGHNIPESAKARDHRSSELVLLYVTTIAAEELAFFG
jgi:hypothetical protein